MQFLLRTKCRQIITESSAANHHKFSVLVSVLPYRSKTILLLLLDEVTAGLNNVSKYQPKRTAKCIPKRQQSNAEILQ